MAVLPVRGAKWQKKSMLPRRGVKWHSCFTLNISNVYFFMMQLTTQICGSASWPGYHRLFYLFDKLEKKNL